MPKVGFKHTEETKVKIRLARAKQIFSKETRLKMSIIHKQRGTGKWRKGCPPWNKGKIGSQVAWNKGLKGVQIPWNKGKKGLQIPWNKGKKFLDGSKNPNWKGGLSQQDYPWNFNEELKELIRKRDNYRCQICGTPQEKCLRKLDVHHKDRNKNNINPNNLITLCRICHLKVSFNKLYLNDEGIHT